MRNRSFLEQRAKSKQIIVTQAKVFYLATIRNLQLQRSDIFGSKDKSMTASRNESKTYGPSRYGGKGCKNPNSMAAVVAIVKTNGTCVPKPSS